MTVKHHPLSSSRYVIASLYSRIDGKVYGTPRIAAHQQRYLALASVTSPSLPTVLDKVQESQAHRVVGSGVLQRHLHQHGAHPKSAGNNRIGTRNVRITASVLKTAEAADDARPVHPRAVKGLYVVYMAACIVERTWRFALPLVLAYVEGGYRAIAVLGFVSPLFCSLLGPALGRVLDKVYRPYGLGLMLSLQGLAIMASGLVVLAAAASPSAVLSEGPLFAALLLLSGLERLTAMLSELAIERDWVTQLAGKDNDLALARSNATLRRTDLVCEALGALAFGALYSTFGVAFAVAAATLMTSIMVPLQIYCITWIAREAPDAMVHGRSEAAAAPFKPPTWKRLLRKKMAPPESTPLSFPDRIQRHVLSGLDGWKTYFSQPILPSSLTFVVLFLNVALSPGGLITAFLTSKGLDGTGMAIFRGGCALMGFAGTGVGRRLIRRYGLINAGTRALAIQFFFLCVAALIYALCLATSTSLVPGASQSGVPLAVVFFAVAVVTSRIGMWSFDMVNAQLFQQGVSQSEVASASAAEMALCNTNELLMLGLAAYFIKPASYSALIYMSLGAVLVANVVFNVWARHLAREGNGTAIPAILTAAAV